MPTANITTVTQQIAILKIIGNGPIQVEMKIAPKRISEKRTNDLAIRSRR